MPYKVAAQPLPTSAFNSTFSHRYSGSSKSRSRCCSVRYTRACARCWTATPSIPVQLTCAVDARHRSRTAPDRRTSLSNRGSMEHPLDLLGVIALGWHTKQRSSGAGRGPVPAALPPRLLVVPRPASGGAPTRRLCLQPPVASAALPGWALRTHAAVQERDALAMDAARPLRAAKSEAVRLQRLLGPPATRLLRARGGSAGRRARAAPGRRRRRPGARARARAATRRRAWRPAPRPPTARARGRPSRAPHGGIPAGGTQAWAAHTRAATRRGRPARSAATTRAQTGCARRRGPGTARRARYAGARLCRRDRLPPRPSWEPDQQHSYKIRTPHVKRWHGAKHITPLHPADLRHASVPARVLAMRHKSMQRTTIVVKYTHAAGVPRT